MDDIMNEAKSALCNIKNYNLQLILNTFLAEGLHLSEYKKLPKICMPGKLVFTLKKKN